MSEFKIGDEVEVLYTDSMGYQGNYKKGMRGKIIFINNKNAKLQDDRNTPHSYWLAFSAIKLAKTKYPNPPLPHCEERIAFAKGANIQLLASGIWYDTDNPRFNEIVRYRVKIEKTKNELLIETLELKINNNEQANADYKKEINELKNKN